MTTADALATRRIEGTTTPQYRLNRLLVLTLVPGVLMLLFQGGARALEGFGGIVATAGYLFAEVAMFLALIYLVTRRERKFGFRRAIPYQAKCGIGAFVLATLVASAWSIYFRDYFSWQPLTDFSQWARQLSSVWPPDFLQRPERGLPLSEEMPAESRIALYSLALVAYGGASAMQTLYFRGFLMPRMSYMGWWAPVANTLLFVIFHLASPWFWPQFFIFTLIWGLVTYATRNVWPAVIGHLIFNTYWFAGQIVVAFGEL